MKTSRPIKCLLHGAIDFLEASSVQQPPERFRRYATGVVYPELFALCRNELTALCNSPAKTRALVLANLADQLAVNNGISTLLVTGKYSLIILAVNLLFWRAGFELEEASNPCWGGDEFARLTSAAGQLANAPLFVVRMMPFSDLKTFTRDTVSRHGIRWLLMDSAPAVDSGDSPAHCLGQGIFGQAYQLTQLSRELGVPITLI